MSNALSTGNASQLEHLKLRNDNILCSKDVSRDDNISLTDKVEAFPIVVSAMEETMQITDPKPTAE